jgi:hypothetical protein
MLYHTIHPLSFASCREWYYDAYYPEVFSSILPDDATPDSVRLGSSWIFYPSLTYYQKTKLLPIAGLEYQKTLVVDTSLHYYFVEQVDTSGMRNAGFVLAKNIGPYFLFKNSSPHSPSGPKN